MKEVVLQWMGPPAVCVIAWKGLFRCVNAWILKKNCVNAWNYVPCVMREWRILYAWMRELNNFPRCFRFAWKFLRFSGNRGCVNFEKKMREYVNFGVTGGGLVNILIRSNHISILKMKAGYDNLVWTKFFRRKGIIGWDLYPSWLKVFIWQNFWTKSLLQGQS